MTKITKVLLGTALALALGTAAHAQGGEVSPRDLKERNAYLKPWTNRKVSPKRMRRVA